MDIIKSIKDWHKRRISKKIENMTCTVHGPSGAVTIYKGHEAYRVSKAFKEFINTTGKDASKDEGANKGSEAFKKFLDTMGKDAIEKMKP